MPPLRRLLAPALPLLLLLAAQPAVSLRTQVKSHDVAATDADVDVEDALPEDHALSLRRSTGGEEESEAAAVSFEADLAAKDLDDMREYQANLSHTRECKTIFDKVGMLAPLVIPRLKLAFCYVPKAACTQFKDLINRLNKINASEGFGRSYLRSRAVMLGVNKSEITRENGWKFAIFTRDPALRYLSAFGSTCVSSSAFGNYEHKFECCGPLVKDNTIPAPNLVSMFGQRAEFDNANGVVSEDDHWVSQTRIWQHCGENFNPKKVDFHGDLSHGDVNKQVKEMLAMVNGTAPWMSHQVDRFFPPSKVAGHKSPLSVIPPQMFYNNRTILESVMQIYADDYESIPDAGQGFTDKQLRKTPVQLQREWKNTLSKIEKGRAELHRQSERRRKDREMAKHMTAWQTKKAVEIAKHLEDPMERFKFYRDVSVLKGHKPPPGEAFNRTEEEVEEAVRALTKKGEGYYGQLFLDSSKKALNHTSTNESEVVAKFTTV